MENKQWYASKQLWVNAIAVVAMVIQNFNGFVIPPEQQMAVLGVINLILRMVTGQPISFGSKTFHKAK